MGAVALAPCQKPSIVGDEEIAIGKSCHSQPSKGPHPRADPFGAVRAMLETQHAVRESLQEQLSGEVDFQKVIWSSAEDSCKTASVQEVLLVTSEHGNAEDLLLLLDQIQEVAEVSPTLRATAQQLVKEEEALLTCQCMLAALQTMDRSALEIWMEHARELGLDLPVDLDSLLLDLKDREAQELQYITKQHDAEQWLRTAIEVEDAELLREAIKKAKAVGVHSAEAQKALDKLRNRSGSSASSWNSDGDESASAADETEGWRTASNGYVRDGNKQGKASGHEQAHGTSGPAGRPPKSNVNVSPPGVPPWRRFNGVSAQSGDPSGTKCDPRSVWDRTGPQGREGKAVTSRFEALMVLGFPSHARPNEKEVRAAYRRAALESHPDRTQNHNRQEDAKAMFQRVHQSFEVLNNDRSSMAYSS